MVKKLTVSKEEFLKKLGANIALVREQAGLTQTQFAAKCNKDRQSINRLEKGNINPSVFYLRELAEELKIPLKDLLDFE